MLLRLAELNFTSPTRIQQQAIPRLLVRPLACPSSVAPWQLNICLGTAAFSPTLACPAACMRASHSEQSKALQERVIGLRQCFACSEDGMRW